MAVKTAVVGLGMMGATHLRAYLGDVDNADLIAVCDVRGELLTGDLTGSRGNIDTGGAKAVDFDKFRKYERYEDLLSDADVDVVDLCTPTFLHAPMAIAAFEAGKHVFCEKPMAMNIEDARRMCDVSEATGRMLQIGQCLRFWPEYLAIMEMIETGRYGPVRSATFRRMSGSPTWSWDGWLVDAERSGSATLDMHIHDTDLIQWFFGVPQGVTSFGAQEPDGGVSHIVTQYHYDNIPLVSAEGGWLPGSCSFYMCATIVFESATAVYNSVGSPTLSIFAKDADEPVSPQLLQQDAYVEELTYFAACVESGKPPAHVPNWQAAMSVGIVGAEIESVKTGKTVAIET